jgi:structural maintenance of chromosome 2
MRAANQQDLIYKRGQAGITKASVTIVFDNSDREKSPVGLENCKQITVTRQVRSTIHLSYIIGHSLTDRTSECFQVPTKRPQITAAHDTNALPERAA